ncbi:2-oxoglutarate and iron-dependent oxygenase domain-containing protein 3-like [Tribolium madens]|uniref:2-oxoglutarate and iron-dependent oxygenase domain-containing protein 3-like n=1 Tax=Tribolium madens TaxID=41895 RepID=UPI001CF730C4|nr:2-oxoglutarate and iron-dependent oxygenase domain-containing protein 3-like [Tribolium madens]
MTNVMTGITKAQKRKNGEKKNNDVKETTTPYRYGPMPKFPNQRIWSRGIVILGVLLYVWYTSKDGKEVSLAKQKDILPIRGQTVECDSKYLDEITQFPTCVPIKCGRFVSDKLVTINEAETLLNVAKKGISLGGSSGGASILDIHSGALSFGEKFVNIYTLKGSEKFITASDLTIYKIVKNKIKHAIAENFGIDKESLYLTHPTFFSKLSNLESKTPHDEYWHIHVDKETYESFHYTSLLYLTDFNVEFKGGRFVFVDNAEKPMKNVTVEPRKGRVLMFTSGAENPHFVERVTSGVRYAITVSFTCDKTKSISDPTAH